MPIGVELEMRHTRGMYDGFMFPPQATMDRLEMNDDEERRRRTAKDITMCSIIHATKDDRYWTVL
jgi:hypothetical protein